MDRQNQLAGDHGRCRPVHLDDRDGCAVMKLLRPREVADKLGVSRRTVYRWEQTDDSFPKRISITMHRVGYLESEVDNWLQKKIDAREVL